MSIVLAIVLVLSVATLAACSPTEPAEEEPVNGGVTPSEPTITPPTPDEPSPVVAYFLSEEQVVPVRRTASDEGAAAAAMSALLEGPTADEVAAGLTSSIPEGTRLLGVDIIEKTATVDLSAEFNSGGGSLSMMTRVAQVVFTLTQFDTIESVLFELEGEPIQALGGEGLILDSPQTRAMWEDAAPAVLIETPVRGDTVPLGEPLRVAGSANVFEAVFTLEVTDGDGLIIATESVTATAGTGTRGTFDVTIPLDQGKPGVGEVIASYASPKDGSRVVVDEVIVSFE
jgi:spore germination protein GerM